MYVGVNSDAQQEEEKEEEGHEIDANRIHPEDENRSTAEGHRNTSSNKILRYRRHQPTH